MRSSFSFIAKSKDSICLVFSMLLFMAGETGSQWGDGPVVRCAGALGEVLLALLQRRTEMIIIFN